MYRKILYPRALEYFLKVAEYGSFSRAAEVLHVSQPSLSQQIKLLEDTLGTRLLIRPGRVVRLTSAGETYMQYAIRARVELQAGVRAVNDVADLSRGTLRLGWTPITDLLTYELIHLFHQRYPGIVLSTLEMSQEYLEQSVVENTIDIGIAFTKPDGNGYPTSDYESLIMFQEFLFLAVGNEHPLCRHTADPAACTEISLDMALLNRDFALRQHIDDHCRKHSLALNIAVETNSLSVIMELAKSSRLITILPRTIIDRHPRLHSFQLETELPQHAVSLIWSDRSNLNPASTAFIDIASKWHPQRHRSTEDFSQGLHAQDIPVLPRSFFQ